MVLVAEGVDVPMAFTVETRKSYEMPLVSPVTIVVVPTETPSSKVSHEELLVSLYSAR